MDRAYPAPDRRQRRGNGFRTDHGAPNTERTMRGRMDRLPDAPAAFVVSRMAPLILRYSTSINQEIPWSAASPSKVSAIGR